MSEKRFKIDMYTLPTTIVDLKTSELYSSMRNVVDLLNSLSEENEQLKYDNFMFKGSHQNFRKLAISERKKLEKEIEELKITIQLYETDVSMRDNFLKSKGLYDEFLQCIWTVNE